MGVGGWLCVLCFMSLPVILDMRVDVGARAVAPLPDYRMPSNHPSHDPTDRLTNTTQHQPPPFLLLIFKGTRPQRSAPPTLGAFRTRRSSDGQSCVCVCVDGWMDG